MKKSRRILTLAAAAGSALMMNSCGPKYTIEDHGQFNLVVQNGGQNLGYSPSSGVSIIEDKGYAFKDLNRNGALDAYEDWRLDFETRAEDLAKQLTKEEIAGLMLYSAHQAVPNAEITEAQYKFLKEDNLRHVLVTKVESPAIAAEWNNNVQAFIEGMGHGIPANNSSDPRHSATAKAEYDFGNGGQISMWPTTLGLAATFDPSVVEEFGRIASLEYRALGLTTALSPQIDIATDPRWSRVNGTFGEDPQLGADMARAYCDGFQSSSAKKTIAEGWGYESVNAMVKHWPGGGAGEGGRDAHYGYGKYAVFPGNNLEKCMYPFTEGAFKLNGGTKMAAAVMPYYTISYGQDPSGQNVGNSYSKYIITDLLRDKYNYNGVVCTDWAITADELGVEKFTGKCWGVEGLTIAERHYKVLMAGVDQFGGNNDKTPVLEAYELGVKEHGEEFMRARFEASAKRLLMNIFRTGLFENPYLDIATTSEVVGNPKFMEAGYQAQLKSIVMLKNKDKILPIRNQRLKVYVPKLYHPAQHTFFGMSEAYEEDAISPDQLNKYFIMAETPEEADFAIVKIETPNAGPGYSVEDRNKGGNGYIPMTLQFNDYKAVNARETSIAGGDPYEDFTNRSYRNKRVKTSNKTDLESVLKTRKAMGDKPVIVVMNMDKPFVVSEFEGAANAILVTFDCMNQCVLDIISGQVEPSALLPMQLPADMKTVEEQYEDTPHDMTPYTDSEGNIYDFAFGLNWNGVIKDARVSKYSVK